jgi:signal transduction histidine kinase/ActR/RegA family two-component response regulator
MNHTEMVNREDQDTIQQQNHALEAFLSITECGIIHHTRDGKRLLSADKAALRLLGYDSLQEMQDNFNMVANSVLDEDKKKIRYAIRKLNKPGDTTNVVYRVIHADGETLDIMCRIKLLSEDGELVCQRVMMDCTGERLHLKRKQERNEAHLNEIVAALSTDYSSVFYLDVDTGIGVPQRMSENIRTNFSALINPEAFHSDLVFEYLQNYVHPDDREEFNRMISLKTMKTELADKNCYYFTYRTINRGAEEYYQAKIVKIGSWRHARRAIVGFCNVDKQIQEEFEQKHRLEEALKQAEQASMAKTTFLSNMSHDIRTPMNAIIGYATLARRYYDEPDRVLDYLDKISTSSNHLLSLINDVLDMSRIESGRISLENVECSIEEVMEDICTVMSGQMSDKNIDFRVDTSGVTDTNVICDKLKLNQVLINIIGNAVKFTPIGGEVDVTLEQKKNFRRVGYAAYQFRIKDNGIGMSEEFQKHLFEQFSREQNSTVSGITGTGLGMAITKSIVEMMNGTISVNSKQGVGTEFIVDVEFQKQTQTVSEDNSGSNAVDSGKLKSINKILLVEDNQLNQEIASEILSSYGFNIDIANNGKEAVDMVQKVSDNCYDVILMDVQMPVMNGYEATKAIRSLADERLSNLPIIAMTANAFDEDRKNALEAGMDDFVTKPFDINVLLKVLAAQADKCA